MKNLQELSTRSQDLHQLIKSLTAIEEEPKVWISVLMVMISEFCFAQDDPGEALTKVCVTLREMYMMTATELNNKK